MVYWHTISEMTDRATRDTGTPVTADVVFHLARSGDIRVGAIIPALDGDDIGELQWQIGRSQLTLTKQGYRGVT